MWPADRLELGADDLDDDVQHAVHQERDPHRAPPSWTGRPLNGRSGTRASSAGAAVTRPGDGSGLQLVSRPHRPAGDHTPRPNGSPTMESSAASLEVTPCLAVARTTRPDGGLVRPCAA